MSTGTRSSAATAMLAAWLVGQASGPAVGQDVIALEGEMFIAGRYVIDPPSTDPTNSHAYITIQGAAAISIYRNMTAAEEEDVCRGDGWRLKRAGDLYCSMAAGGQEAECDFSVDLRDGSLAGGRPC